MVREGVSMNALTARVVESLRRRRLLTSFPPGARLPVPTVNKVEFYPSFHCNDNCPHCITRSGPDREETLSPDDAVAVVRRVAEFSVLKRLREIFGGGEFRCEAPDRCRELEALEDPPGRLSDPLKAAYADCLQGRGCTSKWVVDSSSMELNFGRPSIRISGGEFSLWPFKVDGEEQPKERRSYFQSRLLEEIRTSLPEYDVWILTNGRFAVNQDRADEIIKSWAEGAGTRAGGGRTRVCVSVDVFHRPPPKSTVEEMLSRMWTACRECGLGAPFIYGISNNRVGYLGRAFARFEAGTMAPHQIRNISGSSFNPVTSITVDPVDLVGADGCREVKGFYFEHGPACVLANNIVVAPSGHLVYCCACLGDYGDFVHEPRACLERLVTEPVSMMLRRAGTVAPLLQTAIELDPTIAVFGTGEHAGVTASTCYQMMTGERQRAGGPPRR